MPSERADAKREYNCSIPLSRFDPTFPEPQSVDFLVTVIRTLVSGVPMVGGSITEAWAGFFSSPLARRREHWLRELALAVAELQEKVPGLTIDALQANEQFVSAILSATAIAVRTHQKEKLRALRNASISNVRNPDIDEDVQAMFMRYVDEFTPWHLRVLRAFDDPNRHFREISSGMVWLKEQDGNQWSTCKEIHTFIYAAFPSLTSNADFIETILFELGVRKLIPVSQLFRQKLPDVGPYTTMPGRQFMRFIGENA